MNSDGVVVITVVALAVDDLSYLEVQFPDSWCPVIRVLAGELQVAQVLVLCNLGSVEEGALRKDRM